MMESLYKDTLPEDIANVTTTSHDWQVDKNLGPCLIELYNRRLWTDVCFRCSDHDIDDTADRIRAHKVILAARSPVFQGMFFGPLAQSGNEIPLENIDKETFECFVRYLYSDEAEFTENLVSKVLKVAHMYQVTCLGNACADYLQTIINTENACTILDLALLYDANKLLNATCDFIDNNAAAVIKTDSFAQMTPHGITHLLKGDTFYVQETKVLKHAEIWAKKRCSDNTQPTQEHTGRKIRDTLGPGFFFLRFPTMAPNEFVKHTAGRGFFRCKEYEDILIYILLGKQQIPSTNSTMNRIPKKEIVQIEMFNQQSNDPFWTETPTSVPGLPFTFGQTISQCQSNDPAMVNDEFISAEILEMSISLTIKRQTYLTAFSLAEVTPCLKVRNTLYKASTNVSLYYRQNNDEFFQEVVEIDKAKLVWADGNLYMAKYAEALPIRYIPLPSCLDLTVTGTLAIEDLNQFRTFTAIPASEKGRSVTFDPPIFLPESMVPYTMKLSMHYTCKADDISMRVQCTDQAVHAQSPSGNCVLKIPTKSPIPIQSLEFLNPSLRENDMPTAAKDESVVKIEIKEQNTSDLEVKYEGHQE